MCSLSTLELLTDCSGKNYILAALPEGYRLYEHLKYTASNETGEAPKSARNHAKGPNDRQDAYLYGHPLGRKKRFRSPADFFPHVLWLSTDASGDPANCTCKLCSPEEFQAVDPSRTDTAPKSDPDADQQRQADKPQSTGTPSSSNLPPPTQKSNSSQGSGNARVKPSPSPTPNTPSPAASTIKVASPPPVPKTEPTPLPQLRSREQEVDLQYNQYLFRLGELVWFSRAGTAWGLAVVVLREQRQNVQQQKQSRYVIQPLSHPYAHPSQKMVSDEHDLRPWLAWSAPKPTHQNLADRGLTYDTVDWPAILRGQAGPGDAEVDGSIFAAKAIDESYTPVEQIEMPNAAAGEAYWNGIFLGGEKIWVGEAVRLGIGSGSDILVVHQILEKPRAGFANTPSNSLTYVVGDIYTWSTTTHAPSAEEIARLPARLHADLQHRNAVMARVQAGQARWRLLRPFTRVQIGDVKGRWYESSVLLLVLRGREDFESSLQRGDLGDAGAWLNGRSDAAAGTDRAGTRRATRREALGRAVPQSLRLSKGLDGPPEENVFLAEPGVTTLLGAMDTQQQDCAVTMSQAGGVGGGDGSLEQFMDLDKMEQAGMMQQYPDGHGQFFGDSM